MATKLFICMGSVVEREGVNKANLPLYFVLLSTVGLT